VAGEGEVARRILATVLLGYDMFDMKREERIVVLVKAAVFATTACPPPYQFARESIHYDLALRRARALAWRIATILAAMT